MASRHHRKGHNLVDKIALNNVWLTPESALRPVRSYAPIGLDPCTLPSNPAGAQHFFTEKENGLLLPWDGYGLVYVNPPYSQTEEEKARKEPPPMRIWAKKIHDEAARGVTIIALLPCGARYSTGYFQDHALCHEMCAMCFHRGRVPFINGLTGKVGKQNNYDSQYIGYNVERPRFGAAFRDVGATLLVERYRVGALDGFI